MLFLKILGGVAALLLGIWLGLPGRYERDLEEIDRVMDEGGMERERTGRHFMAVEWIFRSLKQSKKRTERRRFQTVAPERKD